MATAQAARKPNRDRTIVLTIVAVVVVVAAIASFLGPSHDTTDPRPTTYNVGSQGAKAAYLVLSETGYNAERWSQPIEDLDKVDASQTTLVLAEPELPVRGLKETTAAIENFLKRGGRVVATGINGASLLPGGATDRATHHFSAVCFTHPEGAGALAQAGKLSIGDPARWSASGPEYRVEQRCGDDAVVVRYPYGTGEAIWWSSPMPLSNGHLKDNGSLALLLASIGPAPRRVLFDEHLHELDEGLWDTAKGLPIASLTLQCCAVGVLLVFSRGRRNGPLRRPVRMPRTSPLEFAESMGRLYERAGATSAATEAARTRLLRYLVEVCGLPQAFLRTPPPPPEDLSSALSERFTGDWSGLAANLEAARLAAATPLTRPNALKLVQALEADQRELQQRLTRTRKQPARDTITEPQPIKGDQRT